MKYLYKAFVNVFHDDKPTETKVIYTSKEFDDFRICWDYAIQYQYQHGCGIETYQKDETGNEVLMSQEMRQNAR